MPEGTEMLRMDPRVVEHAENEYRRAHVRRWGVSEIKAKNNKFSL